MPTEPATTATIPQLPLCSSPATPRHERLQPLGGKQQGLGSRIAQNGLRETDIGQVQRTAMRPAGIE